jgi:hypothetical protein
MISAATPETVVELHFVSISWRVLHRVALLLRAA